MDDVSLDTYEVEDITIRKLNETFVHVDASASLCQTLSEHFSFFPEGYKWHPKVKARMWDGRIRLFNSRFNTLPLGLVTQLKEFLADSGADIELLGFPDEVDPKDLEADFDRFYSTLTLPEGMEIRDYQKHAVLESLRTRRSIVISPTGSGKSFILYLLLRYGLSRALYRKILLVVPTINLVTQMYKDFAEYSANDPNFDVEKMCHQIYGGKDKDAVKKINITTWQSMDQIKGLKFFEQFDAEFVDEVHLAEAKGITRIVEGGVNALYKIGLTGTLKDSKMNPLALIGLFGELIYTKKTHELMEEGLLSDTPIVAMVLQYPEGDRKEFWQAVRELKRKQQNKKVFAFELKFLIMHRRRNQVIIKLCQKLSKTNTLILFRNIEHIDKIEKILTQAGIDVKRMSSDMEADERDAIRSYVEANSGVVVLSTYQLFQLGINIRNLHNGILAAPAKGRIRILQSLGRLLRPSRDGKTGYLFDLIDDIKIGDNANHTWTHGLMRLKYYTEEKLKIIYKKVTL